VNYIQINIKQHQTCPVAVVNITAFNLETADSNCG